MLNISSNFPISDMEYEELNQKFEKLCWYIAHELKKKNSRNNYIDDLEDIKQELQIQMLSAGSYYKRQVYIEKCLAVANRYVSDTFLSQIVKELTNLWQNRTRHGANRQKYGPFQENILERIVAQVVPANERPSRQDKLKIDSKFTTYCKTIVWNRQKSMGKKITKEKEIRANLISLSEFDYLAT